METGKTPISENPMDINSAMQKIQQIKMMINQMGANDVEMSVIQKIENDLMDRKIPPEEAVRLVQEILERKQGYH